MNEGLNFDFKNSSCFRRARIAECLFLMLILTFSSVYFAYRYTYDIIIGFTGVLVVLVEFSLFMYLFHMLENCPKSVKIFRCLPTRGEVALVILIIFGFFSPFVNFFGDIFVVLFIWLSVNVVLASAVYDRRRWDILQDEVNGQVTDADTI